jgi:hypothetical protein
MRGSVGTLNPINPITVLLEEDDFRIVKFSVKMDRSYKPNPETYIQHCCQAKSDSITGWAAIIFDVDNRDWTCNRCHRKSSDSLQAMFWFLKTEGPE